MLLPEELSGFGLNIEHEVKIRGATNTVIKKMFILFVCSEGSLCVWSKLINISNLPA
tara:strand:+ start:168 stop:338 length:171 start_codon:yes stop_codon:yes gene_type:complete